jgi:peroxiredoxin Q/BCP
MFGSMFGSMFGWFTAQAGELQAGSAAPSFELSDQYGKDHDLAQYRGRWVVVYFYPKNDTPGCTTEACAFRDDILVLRDLGVQLFGVSLDDSESHARFAEKHGLPFPLLSDADGQVARAYGALFALGPLRFAKRHSFIIDPQGRIAKVYRKVDPERHSDQIIADLRALQGAG